MRNAANDTGRSKQIKFAEAGILFVLVLAITIFVGLKFAGTGKDAAVIDETTVEAVAPAPDAAATAAAIGSDAGEAETVAPADGTEDATDADAAGENVAAATVEPPAVTYATAEAAYFEKRYGEAADMFAAYADAHPGNAWGRYMLGLSLLKAGDLEGAEESFDAALAIAPDHVKSLVNLGRVLIDLDRADEALPHVEKAIALDPGSVDAYRVLGRVYQDLDRRDDAVRSYNEALALDDADAWSLNNLGLLYIRDERFADALPALARAVELRDDVACFRNNLGIALERSGHFAAAAGQYAEAVALDGSYDRAAASLERVEGLHEAADLEPVDLAALAASFTVAPVVADAPQEAPQDAAPDTLADGSAAPATTLAEANLPDADAASGKAEDR